MGFTTLSVWLRLYLWVLLFLSLLLSLLCFLYKWSQIVSCYHVCYIVNVWRLLSVLCQKLFTNLRNIDRLVYCIPWIFLLFVSSSIIICIRSFAFLKQGRHKTGSPFFRYSWCSDDFIKQDCPLLNLGYSIYPRDLLLFNLVMVSVMSLPVWVSLFDIIDIISGIPGFYLSLNFGSFASGTLFTHLYWYNLLLK